jgi:hypothetical protein
MHWKVHISGFEVLDGAGVRDGRSMPDLKSAPMPTSILRTQSLQRDKKDIMPCIEVRSHWIDAMQPQSFCRRLATSQHSRPDPIPSKSRRCHAGDKTVLDK